MFNEEKRIRHCLERSLDYFKTQDWDFEIIVVEDGCTDQSINIVKEFSKYDERIILLSLPSKMGKGGSLLRAIKICNKINIGFMDVDLSADPSQFEKMVPFLESNDIIIGSRNMPENIQEVERPINRKVLSQIYHVFFKCLFAIDIQDLQCGFKLFKRDSIRKILSEIRVNGFAFDTEFLVVGKMNNLKIIEVPIVWHHDKNSKMKLISTSFSMLHDLITIWQYVFATQIQKSSSFQGKFIARPIFLFQAISQVRIIKQNLEADILTR